MLVKNCKTIANCGSLVPLFAVLDDLDIAPDFFEYFAALYPVLLADSSLWCISAWNDNGKGDLIEDAPGVYSTELRNGK